MIHAGGGGGARVNYSQGVTIRHLSTDGERAAVDDDGREIKKSFIAMGWSRAVATTATQQRRMRRRRT